MILLGLQGFELSTFGTVFAQNVVAPLLLLYVVEAAASHTHTYSLDIRIGGVGTGNCYGS